LRNAAGAAPHRPAASARHQPRQETIMTNFTRLTLPALAFALCSTALLASGVARAEDAMKPANAMATDAMKPATDAMKPATDAMKPAGAMATDAMSANAMKPAMATDAMKKDCMDKAAMETDAMKKDEATKACDAMGAAN
jgi:pentapeptide MXKDX repeat protein